MSGTNGGQLFVDNTLLSAVARCSTEAVVRHVLHHVPIEEKATLKHGSDSHEALAMYLKGAPKEECLERFGELYQEWADENLAPTDARAFDHSVATLDVWFDRHPLVDGMLEIAPGQHLEVSPDLIEVGFAVPLDEDGEVVFTGRIDAILRDPRSGVLHVVDHKFSGQVSSWWALQFRNESQLTGYLWAASETMGEGVPAAYVNAMHVARLPSDPKRKCKEHSVAYSECGRLHAKSEFMGPFARSQEQFVEWRKTALSLARKFRTLRQYDSFELLRLVRQQGAFNQSCRGCDFLGFCAANREPRLVPSMLMESRWEPVPGLIEN